MRFFRLFFIIVIISFTFYACKTEDRAVLNGFILVNKSDSVVDYVWIAPEGELYPIATKIELKKDQVYQIRGLNPGLYDIAFEFSGVYNTMNSKKDKSLCLTVQKGHDTVWVIDTNGNIIR